MHRRAALRASLLPIALLLACGRSDRAAGPPPRPPAPVRVAEAVRRDVPETLSAVGTVQASTTVSIRPLVGGTVVQVFFTDGDEVRASQKLFQIDPRPYQAALAQARGNLARTRQQAENARADVRRYAPLRRGGYVSPQQYDTAVAAARSLDADLAALRAAVRRAELDLANCLITSPIEGRTGAVLVQRGNVVEANQTAPLVVVAALRPAFAAFSVPERNVAALRQGLGRLAVEATAGGQTRRGTLTFVNNAADPAAGTILARATFPNDDEALWPGAFVDVRVVLGVRRGAVVVPPAAVTSTQAGDSVFVVKPDRTVELRQVEVAQADDRTAVIAAGVRAGEQVVIDGQLDLTPGVRVAPRAAGGAAGGPAVAREGQEAGAGTGAGERRP